MEPWSHEQNASSKRHCHPSRELFRAGDLLFLAYRARKQKSRSPAPLFDFRTASGIAAERGMTVSASKSVILSEAKDLRRYIGLSCGFMVLHESAC
jgi:hypothetical protein